MRNLEIISLHSQFKDKPLRKWRIDGIDTVGVYGDEPYKIRFQNDGKRVQVMVSIDGTNIMTGKKAALSETHEAFVVEPWQKLELTAWVESSQGGSALVFASGEKSVAAHTHGDMTAKGYIGVAVFEEGFQPITWSYPQTVTATSISLWPPTHTLTSTLGGNGLTTHGGGILRGTNPNPNTGTTASFNASTTTGAGTGAGSYVGQKLQMVAGLTTPVFAELIQVRYLWWDEVKQRLDRGEAVPAYQSGHPPGFEGSQLAPMADLGTTPKIDTHSPPPKTRTVDSWTRVVNSSLK